MHRTHYAEVHCAHCAKVERFDITAPSHEAAIVEAKRLMLWDSGLSLVFVATSDGRIIYVPSIYAHSHQ